MGATRIGKDPQVSVAAKLIIVCGLPGSGKTTHARDLESSQGGIRMGPDEWLITLGFNLYDEAARGKVESLQWQLTQRLLQVGNSVILEWGTWTRLERETLRLGGQALGAAVELHFLNPPTAELFQRIQRRNRETPPIAFADLLEWATLFEPPNSDELLRYDGWWISDGTTIRHS